MYCIFNNSHVHSPIVALIHTLLFTHTASNIILFHNLKCHISEHPVEEGFIFQSDAGLEANQTHRLQSSGLVWDWQTKRFERNSRRILVCTMLKPEYPEALNPAGLHQHYTTDPFSPRQWVDLLTVRGSDSQSTVQSEVEGNVLVGMCGQVLFQEISWKLTVNCW